jgi:hypothetical protein
METISIIFETLCRIVYAIVGGAISIAFVGGIIGAFAYMLYYIIRYGWKAFDKEFIPR